MKVFNIHHAKQRAKNSDCFLVPLIKTQWLKIKSLPNMPFIFKALYSLHMLIKQVVSDVLHIDNDTPLFNCRGCIAIKQQYLYAGLPIVISGLETYISNKIKFAAVTTISGRSVDKSLR